MARHQRHGLAVQRKAARSSPFGRQNCRSARGNFEDFDAAARHQRVPRVHRQTREFRVQNRPVPAPVNVVVSPPTAVRVTAAATAIDSGL